MAGRADVVVRAPGISKLRRDLRNIDKDLGREATQHVRGVVKEVGEEARELLHERSEDPQNRIEKTIKASVTRRGGSIYSNHPGSGVQEWGGEIEPRGTPIEIRGKAFMRAAVEIKAEHVDEQLGDLLDVIANRHGF